MATNAHHNSSSSSSSSSSYSSRQYDVFLSFRGRDTRKNFTAHLYNALDKKGIHTFLDDEALRIGTEIGPELLRAIEQSIISIPIFSKDYASSKWCLKELAEIRRCYKENDQIVFPIFLDVEPSEVRNQTARFGEAFQNHEKNLEKPELINKWRDALNEIGKLKGWDPKEATNGDESKLAQLVVGMVLNKLSNTPLVIAKHPIGLNIHVEYLLGLLNLKSKEPQFVGIWGMGGVGKTTMTKAVYNIIFKKFDGSSFLVNVREEASKDKKLKCLQEQLLKDILGQPSYDISNFETGKTLLRERLQQKKVLIILDDVDNRHQLEALAGGLDWFGPGSRIIITTRDEQVLKVGGVPNENIYKPEGLSQDVALQLFSLHAFGNDQPPGDYLQLSKEVVKYAGGLPLTLEVLGSCLYGVEEVKEWKSTLLKMEKVPHHEIQDKLKISYDGLDGDQKAIFLDIACLFIGMEKEVPVSIWEACGFHPHRDLKVLIQKSLIKIKSVEWYNFLEMHDQVRDMGRRIVYEETKNPKERSRLWSSEEVIEVSKEKKGTPKVEGIYPFNWERGTQLRIKGLAKMSNLRFLMADCLSLKGNIKQLPQSLKWLRWHHCPLKMLPSDFYLKKLVFLDLTCSAIKQAWNTSLPNKIFENLKILNLGECMKLAISPSFSGCPKLERLDLSNCMNLVVVDESVGQLKSLVDLSIDYCGKLISLPKLPPSLIILGATFCTSLGRLSDLSNMINLRKLHLTGCYKLTEIQGLEGTISLEILDLGGCPAYTLELPFQDCFDDSPFSTFEEQQSYVIGDNEINNGLGLCLVFELEEEKQVGVVNGLLFFKTCINRNGKLITHENDWKIKGIQTTGGRKMCTHYLHGLNWFGIPLKSKDEIKIEIQVWGGGTWLIRPELKWFVPIQAIDEMSKIEKVDDMTEQVEASAEMEDLISASYVDDGESHYGPKEQEEGEHAQRVNKRRRQNKEGGGPSRSYPKKKRRKTMALSPFISTRFPSQGHRFLHHLFKSFFLKRLNRKREATFL